jgi:anaerobic selenocysteine-containing dehydrogenase
VVAQIEDGHVEAKPHGEILRRLARAMNLAHPALHETDEQIAATALPAVVTIAALKAAGWIKSSSARPVPGATAKLRLCGGVPMPTPMPAPNMMQLLTPKGHYFLNSIFANRARHRRSMKRPMLEMNREDAATRGLVDGQRVEIRTDRGSLRVHLTVTDDIHRGVVALPGKWRIADVGTSVTVNDLMVPAWSPAGQGAYNEVFVEVLPLE